MRLVNDCFRVALYLSQVSLLSIYVLLVLGQRSAIRDSEGDVWLLDDSGWGLFVG